MDSEDPANVAKANAREYRIDRSPVGTANNSALGSAARNGIINRRRPCHTGLPKPAETGFAGPVSLPHAAAITNHYFGRFL
jgi:hypothetical protein